MSRSPVTKSRPREGFSRRDFLTKGASIALSTPLVAGAGVVTLLDALRNYLDYTGAKKVCDRATCGSCTVILGGKMVYSCSVLAIEAQGKDITTVEGLSANGKLAPIQAAFVENDAQQCGFCTPGFVVACKAFLDKHPSPTLADVEKGLGGNLCRCGTYAGVRQAVLAAANTMRGGQKNG